MKYSLFISLIAIGLMSCKKETDDSITHTNSSNNDSGLTTFFNVMDVDSSYDDEVLGMNYRNDMMILAGRTNKTTEQSAFLMLVNGEGNVFFTNTFPELSGFSDPDFLIDGGFVCRGYRYSNVSSNYYFFSSRGLLTASYDIQQVVKEIGLEFGTLGGIFVTELNDIIVYGYGNVMVNGIGQEYQAFVIKLSKNGSIVDYLLMPGTMREGKMRDIAGNRMVLVMFQNREKLIKIIDNNLDVISTGNPEGLRMQESVSFLATRPDASNFYYGQHKFRSDATYEMSMELTTWCNIHGYAISNDKGLIVGGGDWSTPGNDNAFHMEKLSAYSGSSEWLVRRNQNSENAAEFVCQLRNGSIMGITSYWTLNGTKDFAIFKANSQGKI